MRYWNKLEAVDVITEEIIQKSQSDESEMNEEQR